MRLSAKMQDYINYLAAAEGTALVQFRGRTYTALLKRGLIKAGPAGLAVLTLKGKRHVTPQQLDLLNPTEGGK